MEDGLVAQWLEHYPDKIGVVGSSPTEPTDVVRNIMVSSRMRGVSPDKTDCLTRLRWPLALFKKLTPHHLLSHCHVPKYHLQKYQPAKASLAGILFVYPTRGRAYNVVTDDANKLPLLTTPHESPLTLPEYVVEVCASC